MKPAILEELARARLLGHPLHAMFVHFPAALFPVAFIFELFATLTSNAMLATASFYAMGAGLIGGLAAATFGAIDFFNLPNYTRRWRVASRHALINLTVLLGYAVFFAIRLGKYPDLAPFSGLGLMFMAILAGLTLYGNFLGGELVFRHHMGIIEEDDPQLDESYPSE